MSAPGGHPLHGVAMAVGVDADGPLAGALLLGASGAGKSALALGLLATCPWRRTALVADDAVLLAAQSGRLIARAPARIEGLLEIRGFGPAPAPRTASARLVAAFDLDAPGERLPAPGVCRPLAAGPEIPLFAFGWPGGEASAPHRLRLILRSILGGQS